MIQEYILLMPTLYYCNVLASMNTSLQGQSPCLENTTTMQNPLSPAFHHFVCVCVLSEGKHQHYLGHHCSLCENFLHKV